VRKVAPLNGVKNFIGFLERVFANGVKGLFAIPRAASWCAQPGHEADYLLKKSRSPRRIG
jgi:hypothetical protein